MRQTANVLAITGVNDIDVVSEPGRAMQIARQTTNKNKFHPILRQLAQDGWEIRRRHPDLKLGAMIALVSGLVNGFFYSRAWL